MKRTLKQLLSSKLHRLCALLYLLVWPFLTIFSRWHDRNMSEPRRTPSFSYNQPIVIIKFSRPRNELKVHIFSHHFSLKCLSPLPYLTSINDATVKLSIIWFRLSLQIVTKNLDQPIKCMQLKQGVHVYLLPSTPNSILAWLVVLMIKYASQKCKEIIWILTAKTPIATNRKKTIAAAAISTISQSLIVDFSVKRKWEREPWEQEILS